PATAVTLLRGIDRPPGPNNPRSAAVKVVGLMVRSNVTRMVARLFATGPPAVALMTRGGVAVVVVVVVVPTGGAASRTPPVLTLPVRLESFLTCVSTWLITCWEVHVGCSLHTRAITPLTSGVAIEVPLSSP